MSANKTNPRKVPKTLADWSTPVMRGVFRVRSFCSPLLSGFLCEKHNAPAEDVKQLSHEIQYLLENIAAGNVSFPLVKRTLKEEYNWEVNFYIDNSPNKTEGSK